jgi:hypothetical protein
VEADTGRSTVVLRGHVSWRLDCRRVARVSDGGYER